MKTTISVFVTQDKDPDFRRRRRRDEPTNLDRLKAVADNFGYEVLEPLSGNEWQISGPDDEWETVVEHIGRHPGLIVSMVSSGQPENDPEAAVQPGSPGLE